MASVSAFDVKAGIALPAQKHARWYQPCAAATTLPGLPRNPFCAAVKLHAAETSTLSCMMPLTQIAIVPWVDPVGKKPTTMREGFAVESPPSISNSGGEPASAYTLSVAPSCTSQYPPGL